MDRKLKDGQHVGSQGPSEEVLALARYLSDEVPPMLCADAIARLAELPDVVAGTIHAWVGNQYTRADPLPLPDYLFHAAKKLHLLLELELVDQERLRTLLVSLYPLLLELCPEADRAGLARNLRSIGHEKSLLSAPVEVVHRPAGSGAVSRRPSSNGRQTPRGSASDSPAVDTARIADGLERLNLLLDRFELPSDSGSAPKAGESERRQALLAEIVGELTASSSSDHQLRSQLGLLGNLGIQGSGQELLQLLSRSLPDWVRPAESETEAAPVETMKRVVGLASSSGETRKRFHEFVEVALREFNTGALGRAATLFRSARQMVESGDVDSTIARAVTGQLYARLDQERLRQELESEQNFRALRHVLEFFPQVSVDELLLELEVEQKRDRRRFIVGLLRAHGPSARLAALTTLSDSMSGRRNLSWYVERNLIHLLVSVPRPDGQEPSPAEIEVLGHYSEIDGQYALVREAARLLGSTPGAKAESIAVARVGEIEQALLGLRECPHSADEMQTLLDTLVKDLGKRSSPKAWLCAVSHGLKKKTALGDVLARIAELGRHDLGGEPKVLGPILERLRNEIPVKVFGVTVAGQRRLDNTKHLIRALSGTDSSAVREVLSKIVEQFRDHELATIAQSALRRAEQPSKALPERDIDPSSVAGDIGLFGLPNLLQNLSDSKLTGVLTIDNRGEGTVATVQLDEGRLAGAEYGRLKDELALYQLLQRPLEGRFSFARGTVEASESAADLVSVLLEGMRRYDELTRAVALVPDESRFKTGANKPGLPDQSANPKLAKAVWEKALKGATAFECEVVAPVDSFQVRSLLAHWVNQGALKPAAE